MKLKNINYIKNNTSIPAILTLCILIYSLVAVYYNQIIYAYSIILYCFMIFILFLLFILLVYVKLYTWRKLPLSLPSFTFFAINFIQLTLYLSAISFFFSIWYYDKSLPPVYLENLSLSSQYRYLFLTIISFFFICGYLLLRIFKLNFQPYISFLTYPYLKEEIRLLIDTWNTSIIIAICNKIIDLLYFSSPFRITYFFIHFFLFSIIRLLTTTLLFFCVFYQGNFANFLYLTPLMLLIWLLSFFNFYFVIFQQNATTYIRALIQATPNTEGKKVLGIIKIDPAQISAYFQIYFKLTFYINYFIIILNIFIWFYITYIFFVSSINDCLLSGGFATWLKSINIK